MRRIKPFWAASLLVLPLVGFAVGCGDDTPKTGTQAPIDQKQQEDQQAKMKEFMAKKGQGGQPSK